MPSLRIIIPLALLFSATAFVGGYLLLRPPAPPAQRQREPVPLVPNPPAPDEASTGDTSAKLVVLVVFDQLRGDYLSRWAELFVPDGFNRFKNAGIWFSNCHIPYACTSTGPGHASLVTGAPPSVNGIIENAWYDRPTAKVVYCCEPTREYDLIPPVPKDLGKPGRGAAKGFSPERLLVPTVGDALIEATGGQGRVISLAIKDRAAVLMGGHKAHAVYCFDVRDGQFHTGAYYQRDTEHAWVRDFNRARLVDSWFNQSWEKLDPKLDYDRFSGPDDAEGEASGVHGAGRTFPHSYRGRLAAPGSRYYAAVETSPAGNELLLALAQQCIAAEKLGHNTTPDFLCLSFSSNDLVGHLFGPDSQEVLDITLRSDRLMADFLRFLDSTVGKGRYVVVVTADHGICPLPERPHTKETYPAAGRWTVTEIANNLTQALNAIYGGTTTWLEKFDDDVWPWLYLNHSAIEARQLKVSDVANVVRDWLAGRAFLETAFTRAELEDGLLPADQPLKKMAVLAYHKDRCGDVLVIPKPGVLVMSYPTGTGHGSPHSYDTHIPFLIYGSGVPALGERKEWMSSLAIAPTLAWALGVPAPRHNASILPPDVLPMRK